MNDRRHRDTAGAFQRFLTRELAHCMHPGQTDETLTRLHMLLQKSSLSSAEADERAGLLNRIRSRWRWRTATLQALQAKRRHR